MQYVARYAHDHDNGTPGRLTLDASTDAEAKAEVIAFVKAGYRNSTWCSVELGDGSTYTAHNKHGSAVAGIAS